MPDPEQPDPEPTALKQRSYWRSRTAQLGLVLLTLLVLLALLAPAVTPYHYRTQNLRMNRLKPGTGYIVTTDHVDAYCHWAGTPLEWGCAYALLGTDALGRDLYSKIIYGLRFSLGVALFGLVASTVVGGAAAFFAARSRRLGRWYGQAADGLLMFVSQLFDAMPPILLVFIIFVIVLGWVQFADANQSDQVRWIKVWSRTWRHFALLVPILLTGWVQTFWNIRRYLLARWQVDPGRNFLGTPPVPEAATWTWGLVPELTALRAYVAWDLIVGFLGLGPLVSLGRIINEGYPGIKSNPHLIVGPALAAVLLALAISLLVTPLVNPLRMAPPKAKWWFA